MWSGVVVDPLLTAKDALGFLYVQPDEASVASAFRRVWPQAHLAACYVDHDVWLNIMAFFAIEIKLRLQGRTRDDRVAAFALYLENMLFAVWCCRTFFESGQA